MTTQRECKLRKKKLVMTVLSSNEQGQEMQFWLSLIICYSMKESRFLASIVEFLEYVKCVENKDS